MFGRPRCREWTPLATQQLRLRSLIQIVGYNIRPPECCRSHCSFYLTLHHTTMSAPFYTSERICSPHPKWKEIDSEITQRMSSNNIVIRIWCHELHENEEYGSQDTVIQTWGVYFSGLRYIGANLALNFTSDCFKSNTLVFQMLGGYFCSYKSLKLDIIPPENEIEQGSLSSDSSGRTNLSKINLDPKFILHNKIKESRSISPNKFSRKFDKEYSKSQSPVERHLKQFSTIKTSTSLNIQSPREKCDDGGDRKQPDQNFIYEHSPESNDVIASESYSDKLSKNPSREDLYNSKIDLSETAENYDLRNESDVPKYRYFALNFLKSEIRKSYNAKKLQQLHILQYEIKKKQDAVQEIKEKIYQRSALASDWSVDSFDEKLRTKSKSQRNIFSPEEISEKAKLESDSAGNKNGRVKEERPKVNGPRLTLKLNDLLSFKAKPSPFQRAEALRLTKQIEVLRFKRLILVDERDRKLATLRRLKELRAKLIEQNQDVGLELLEDYHALSRRCEILKETRQSCAAVRELAARSHASLREQRLQLLDQLHQIFYIQQPLRYKITLLGSASKILDITPDLPNPNIPLFARGGDVALFRYAMFLLNKCIAQLLYARGLPVTDMRPTLANLRRLLAPPPHRGDTSKMFGTYHSFSGGECPRTQSLRSLVASERGKHVRQFNRFKDAVDGQSPASLIRRHRHSRSVGSYRDEQELPTLDQSTTSIMGSEPNIYNTKLTEEADIPPAMKTHNSDSEISRMSEINKIVFTLGEDKPSEAKLVKLSSNNDDMCVTCLQDNVKTICSEITDFCTKEVHEGYDIAKHINSGENIDIVKHIEMRASEIENIAVCKGCKREEDGECDLACAKNVHDVIVIPSAEAILDTGQDALEDLKERTKENDGKNEEYWETLGEKTVSEDSELKSKDIEKEDMHKVTKEILEDKSEIDLDRSKEDSKDLGNIQIQDRKMQNFDERQEESRKDNSDLNEQK